MKRFRSHIRLPRLIATLMLAWLLMTLGWLIGRCQGLGGRPLVIIWGYDPGDYDPQTTSDPVAYSVFRYACEPLFYEGFDGAIHGLLAEDEVEYQDDGHRLTVHLRGDIFFHDGTPLTAEAVQASFERLQYTAASPLLNDLRDVTVKAQPDGKSVMFTLPESDYEFVRLVLSNPYAAIVSAQESISEEPSFIACTGPYEFVASLYRPGQSLTLARYPQYHWPPAYLANRGAASIPQIRFVFEPDRNRRLALLLDGEGCVLSLSQEQVESVATLPYFRLHGATGGLTYLGFNFQRSRWQDTRVREAVALALDKAALADSGPFLVADTPLASDAIGYDPHAAAFGYGHECEVSRALLAQADFDTAAEIVLLIPESRTYRDLAAMIQQQLADVGLEQITVRAIPRTDLATQRQDFDLLLFDYAWRDYTALGIFLGPGPRNLLNYSGDEVANLIWQARRTADSKEQQEFVLDAQRIVLQQILWQPLLVRRITFAVNGRCVQGERQSPSGELLFHDADTRLLSH